MACLCFSGDVSAPCGTLVWLLVPVGVQRGSMLGEVSLFRVDGVLDESGWRVNRSCMHLPALAMPFTSAHPSSAVIHVIPFRNAASRA